MRLERCRLCSDHVRSLDVIGDAMKAIGSGEAGAWDDVIYFLGQRERLVVMWGARGEQEVLGASYSSVSDDGKKGDRVKRTDSRYLLDD